MSRRASTFAAALAAAAMVVAGCATAGGGSSSSTPPAAPPPAGSQTSAAGASTTGATSSGPAGSGSQSSADAAGSSTGAAVSQPAEKITLTFQSLAFADTTVAATKKIVADWNAANPNIQVNLVQGSWDNVHDQLVTQFQGGTAPDIIHDESSDITGFGQQGFLADLSPYIPAEVKSSVSDGVWNTITVDGKIVAAPTLLQTYVVFANTKMLADAGVTAPSGDTMSWDELRTMAKSLTKDGSYGLGWGLKSPTATMMNMSVNFGGDWFKTEGGKDSITVTDAELQVPTRIHDMAYGDKSIDPTSLTQSGGDTLPGFYAGKYALMGAADYVAQQITEQAPKDFQWTVLPPLKGTTADQAANPQTLSVSATSKHVKEAAEFVMFFLQDKNLASVALGDWLIPSTKGARTEMLAETGGKSGWKNILASGDFLKQAKFQSVGKYPQWKNQIATPAFQQYLANKIDKDALVKQLTDGWAQVAGS